MKKLVSIIIPTFNPNKKFFVQALDSILNQSYSNLEVIIIDDSTNSSVINFIEKYARKDLRIRFIHNDVRLGISESLNLGIRISKGEYIFRMDDDDISLKKRIEIQVAFMENHKNIDILGTQARFFGKRHSIYKVPIFDAEIKSTLILHNPFVHPSIVFRSSSIEKYGLKYKNDAQAEDYSLWSYIFINYPDITFANLNKVLIKYRIHNQQLTSSQREKINLAHSSIWKNILEYYKVVLNDSELAVYCNAINGARILNFDELILIDEVFHKIKTNNHYFKIVENEYLNKQLDKYYNKICFHQYYYKNNINVVELKTQSLHTPLIKIWYCNPFSLLHILSSRLVRCIKNLGLL